MAQITTSCSVSQVPSRKSRPVFREDVEKRPAPQRAPAMPRLARFSSRAMTGIETGVMRRKISDAAR